MNQLDDTIAAVATAPGEGAIAVVRASGPGARALGEALVRDRRGVSLPLRGRSFCLARVVAPSGRLVDEVLALWMPGPQSYTRQDVLELQCHGGAAAAAAVLHLLLEGGARLADPGEFTLRAFLGGRLDLVQAEAVLDTIRAETADALAAHEQLLDGKLSAEVGQWQHRLGRVLAALEVGLDFDDEGEADGEPGVLEGELDAVLRAMEEKLATFSWGRLAREGFTVALVGAPNTGKSSLLNALAEGDHVMVSPLAGTTRDTVEVRVNALGVPVRLVDTAGLRSSDDPLEVEGVRRARKAAQRADFVLLVCDGSRPLSDEESQEARRLAKARPARAVVNKADLGVQPAAQLTALFGRDPLEVSAHTGQGLASLLHALREGAWGEGGPGAQPGLTRLRHRTTVEEARDCTARALEGVRAGDFAECVAREVQGARDALRRLLGWGTSEDVLDRIFREFCIGK